MNDLTPKKDEVYISTLEISSRTDKKHQHVMRDTRMMFAGLEVDPAEFEGTYTDAKGEQRPCFYLTRYYAMILATGYDVKYRALIIAFWEEHHDTPAKTELLPQFQTMMDMVTQLNDHEVKLRQTQSDVLRLEGEVARVRKISGDAENFMSIKAYINLNGIFLPPRSTGPLGKVCTKFCKGHTPPIPVTTVPDATYGKLNIYPVVVIKEAIEQFLIKLEEKKEK